MAVRRLHPDQPPHFAFTDENLAWAKAQIAKFPEGKQAAAIEHSGGKAKNISPVAPITFELEMHPAKRQRKCDRCRQ